MPTPKQSSKRQRSPKRKESSFDFSIKKSTPFEASISYPEPKLIEMTLHTPAQIRSQIIYYRAAAKLWMELFNRTDNPEYKKEAQESCVRCTNKLHTWQSMYERLTGKPYNPEDWKGK